jgi:D-alanyl-D-alanine carboxypeptidase (penicillin-binding protein 5/6)
MTAIHSVHTGNRRLGRRFFCCLLAVVLPLSLLLTLILPAYAAEEPPQTTDVGAVLVVNLENNLTLYEKEADTVIYPSSSVKIMTGLLACRALAERSGETVTVTAAMLAGVTGRRMNPPLADGEKITVRDLLYAAICGSYNDATAVVACLAGGSVPAFVEDMNTEAQRLGTIHTRYTNPTGLHDPAMATSVRDVALIAREAYENPLFMQICTARTHTVAATNISEARSFSNRNYLVSDSSQNYFNGYCKGMNAGQTDEGGWCVVTVCERNGASNLCIAMRGRDVGADELIPAYVYVNQLLSWANRAYTYRTVLSKGETLETMRVGMTGVSKSKAKLVPAEDLKIYLPADLDVEGYLEYGILLDGGELSAPLTAGQEVGTVTVSYGGHIVGKAPLTVTEDFKRSGFLNAMQVFKSYLMSRAFLLAIPIFLLLLLPYLYLTGSTRGRFSLRSVRRRRRIKYSRRF